MRNACTLGALLLTLIAGCSVESEPTEEAPSPIQGGTLDMRDLAVVGLSRVDGTGYIRHTCTGTLIAPNLVLTAQHCVADTKRAVDCATSTFAPPSAPENVRVTASPSIWGDDVPWIGAAAVFTPPGGRAVCGRDVALVVLAAPLPDVTPLAPRLDEQVLTGEPYAAIGYGLAGQIDGGHRRRRDKMEVQCVGDACNSRQVTDAEWRGDRGICRGDSGGPALDAVGRVIGVTSRGPSTCEKPIYGGVAPHAGWIREVARSAAQRGGYAEPRWCQAEPPPETPALEARGGCAAAPGKTSRNGASSIVLAGLAFAARRRRRAASFRSARG